MKIKVFIERHFSLSRQSSNVLSKATYRDTLDFRNSLSGDKRENPGKASRLLLYKMTTDGYHSYYCIFVLSCLYQANNNNNILNSFLGKSITKLLPVNIIQRRFSTLKVHLFWHAYISLYTFVSGSRKSIRVFELNKVANKSTIFDQYALFFQPRKFE